MDQQDPPHDQAVVPFFGGDGRQQLGRYGEAYAARYLVEHGMEVLDRNWRCAAGEIDLVLRDGDVLVVCEVKTRASLAFGSPFEAVTERKLARLRPPGCGERGALRRWALEPALSPWGAPGRPGRAPRR